VANFAYLLAKEYHRFYHDVRILGAASSEEKNFRLELSKSVGDVLKISMDILGIEMPSRM
jgi:arginyl-tRNA synthetase